MGMGTRLLAKTNRLSLIGFFDYDRSRGPIATDEIANAEAKKSNEKNHNSDFGVRFVSEAQQLFCLEF